LASKLEAKQIGAKANHIRFGVREEERERERESERVANLEAHGWIELRIFSLLTS